MLLMFFFLFFKDDIETITRGCRMIPTDGKDKCEDDTDDDGKAWACKCHSDFCNQASYTYIYSLWTLTKVIITAMIPLMNI